MRCILCEGAFAPSSEEHILPNALGWPLATREIICSSCNQATSRTDVTLTDAVKAVTTFINPPHRRSTAPSIRPRGTDAPIQIAAGGKVRLPDVYQIDSPDDGKMFSISDDALGDFRRKQAERGRGVEIRSRIDAVDVHDSSVTMVDVHMPAILAPLCKTALHACAYVIRDWDRRGAPVEALRHAALSTEPGWPSGLAAWDFDQAPLDSSPFYHALSVTSCPQTGIVAVRIHVYGLIRIRFVVDTHYTGSEHAVTTIVVSPRTGQQNQFEGVCPHPLPLLNVRNW